MTASRLGAALLTIVNWSPVRRELAFCGREGSVAAYRIYEMDGAGRFSKAEWIEAGTDEAALATARARTRSEAFEVWQGGRLVGKSEGRKGS